MDGTLLNSNHEVSSRFLELFKELKKRDIQFVAASGRQYHSMRDKLSAIAEDILIIAENGALIKEKEEELLVTPLDVEVKGDLLAKVEQIDGAHAMLCGKYTSYFDGKSAAFLDQLKEYYSNYQIVDSYAGVRDEILKIAVYHPVSAEKHIFPAVQSMENKIKVKVSGQNWVDLNHSNANKGYALQHIMEQQNLTAENIMVFGDYNNDLEMLALTNFSFAMENAHPNVKKVANYATASNNDFGVERVLEKLLEY